MKPHSSASRRIGNTVSGLAISAVLCAVLTAVTVGTTPTAAAASADAGSGIITTTAGKCVDVRNGDPVNGITIQLWPCNGSPAQGWSLPGDGTIRAYGKCMDVRNGATARGTAVQLFVCNGSGAQEWVRNDSTGAFVNPRSGRCLDARNGSTSDGTPLQIWDCNTTVAQQWIVVPLYPLVLTAAASAPYSAACVDVGEGGNGTPAELWPCNGSAAQRWNVSATPTYPGGTVDGPVRALGKCLDVRLAGTDRGTTVQLFPCNGSDAQRWITQLTVEQSTSVTSVTLTNPRSGRCLDVRGGSLVQGTPLQIWDCNGSAAQRFRT